MTRTMIVWTMCALCWAATASAQFESGSVVGTVRDESGAVVPEVTLTLLGTETGVAVTRRSGPDGAFEFANVRPGVYAVTAERPGLAVALVDGVQVQVGARPRVEVTMSIGQLSERVEVTATTPLLETDRSERGQVISGEQIRGLPLNGREYSSLALLTTGVRQSALNKSTHSTPREGAFNVNGLRSVFNNFLIDGVDNNAYGTSNQGFSNQVMQPSPDAVAEFKVVTNRTKHPTYFKRIGLPLEPRIVDVLTRHGKTRRDDPVFIQSFELSSLQTLRLMTPLRLIQLLDEGAEVSSARLAAISTCADGIGPHKRLIVPANADQTLGRPTSLVEDAHRAGLLVHVWTMRSEENFLSPSYDGDPEREYHQFAALGVDGIFSDFPDVAVRTLRPVARR